MSYYMGDYRGDYYMGDPGIGSFFKKALGFGASFIPGVGPLASRAISAIGRRAPTRIVAMAKPAAAAITAAAGATSRAIVRHPVLSAAGAAGAVGLGETMMHHGAATVPGQHGFHISRKTGRIVRNRHMRVTNPKALKRALRRAHGFARLAMRTIHLVHPRKKARFGGFRKHRKRAA